MPFTIQTLRLPPAVVISVTGELDVAAAPLLRTAIIRSLEERSSQIILDLRDVTFVDAAGIQSLARAQAEAGIRGARLEVSEWSSAFERLAVRSAAHTIMRATDGEVGPHARSYSLTTTPDS